MPATILERVIEEKGLQKVYLARELGLSRSHFSHILAKRRALPDGAAEKLALLLGVPAWLFVSDGVLIDNVPEAAA